MDKTSVVSGIVKQAMPVTEAPLAAPAEGEAPKHVDVSPKLYDLAKKEKDIVAKKRAVQEKEAELAKREARLKELEDRDNLWDKDPLEYLKAKGKDPNAEYNRMTERLISGGELTPQQLKQELEDFKKSVVDKEVAAQEAAQARSKEQETKAISDFKEALKANVTQYKDKYKMTALLDTDASLIFETIETYYQETSEKDEDGNTIKPGKVLSKDEATDLVEKYLVKMVRDAYKALGPEEAEAIKEGEAKAKESDEQAASKSMTLTNKLSSSIPSILPPKTEGDRLKRAMAALQAK
jgi:hypothetical protein